MMKKFFFAAVCTASLITLYSCSSSSAKTINTIDQTQRQLKALLEKQNLDSGSRYAIVNQIANNQLSVKDYQNAILFLTDWVERHPDDTYDSYWLLMTAYAYLSTGAEPFAEYYFDRILRQYPDLLVKGQSIHFICLKNLIRISKIPRNRIKYFNEMINRFPSNVSITELYLRLALEYEKDSDWSPALKSFSLFLEQPDASTIQIAGEPNAYNEARQLVDFNNSSKDWTFESLPALENAVKKAISSYNWRALDNYRSKVNFFSMSWKQDEMDANSQEEFSMRNYMRGQRIYFSKNLDEGTTPNEAYLKTWGWSQYVSTWYLYFRKVNFPVDPDIHGNWEWAGIYMGDKL
ncbi:MAG: tetratricopeptide repeat protein [Treponema sp.]|nr:tetratricopeptide repeat protein [Treponema sp.]